MHSRLTLSNFALLHYNCPEIFVATTVSNRFETSCSDCTSGQDDSTTRRVVSHVGADLRDFRQIYTVDEPGVASRRNSFVLSRPGVAVPSRARSRITRRNKTKHCDRWQLQARPQCRFALSFSNYAPGHSRLVLSVDLPYPQLALHRAPGKIATAPLCMVLVRSGLGSNSRPTNTEADVLTTMQRSS